MKEAQRLLLWCGIQQQKPLSDLTRDDFEQYREFLCNPLPRHVWCGPRTSDKTQWKAFVGPLSASASQTAMTILHSMLHYLVQAGYLLRNPLALLRQKVSSHAEQQRRINSLARKLEIDEVQALLTTLTTLPETTSLQDQAEIPLTHIRDNLGHSDIKVTSIYLHSSDIKRHEELQRVKLTTSSETA